MVESPTNKSFSWKSLAFDIPAALAAAFLQFVFSMSYAAGIFADKRNSNCFGTGLMMTAIAMVVTQVLYSWRSEIPYMFICPDSFYPPLVRALSIKLSNDIDDDEVFANTFICALCIAIFVVGVFKFLAGHFGLLRLTDYIPYPVVCGLMAGIGFNVLYLSVQISTNCELQYAINYLPALCVGVVNILANSYGFNPAVSFTVIITASVVCFYSSLYGLNGLDIPLAQHNNWIFEAHTVVSQLWLFPVSEGAHILAGGVDFPAIWRNCCGDFVGIATLIVIKTSLTVPAYEKALKRRFDKSSELSKYGIATLLAAPLGAAGTCPGITILAVIVQMRGGERVPTYLCPLIFALWYLTRFSFVPYAPKFIFAGLLLSSGYTILVNWLLLPFYRIPKMEWSIVLLIVLFFQFFGMLNALAFGAVLSVLLFAFQFHEAGCIQFISDLSMFRSSVERSHQHNKFLDTHCLKVRVIQLQGFLSFANVGQLFDVISLSMLKPMERGQVAPASASSWSTARSSQLDSPPGYFQLSDSAMPPQQLEAVHSALLLRQAEGRSRSLSRSLEDDDDDDEEDGLDDENLYDDGDELDVQEITYHSYQRSESLRGLPVSLRPTPSQQAVGGRPTIRVRPTAVVVNCQHLLGLDASAIDVLEQVAGHCRQNGCSLIFAAVKKAHYRILKRTKLFDSTFPMTAGNGSRDRDRDRGVVPYHPAVGFTAGLNEALQMVEDNLLAQQGWGDGDGDGDGSLFLSPSPSAEGSYQDFYQCLQIIQNKLSVTIDVQDIMKLAAECIPFHFKQGQPIQVHLADLVRSKQLARAMADTAAAATITASPLSRADLGRHQGTGAGTGTGVGAGAPSYSKRSLGKNVRGLFFLYKGYVTCRDRASLAALHDDDDASSSPPKKSIPGLPFQRLSSLSRRRSLDSQIRRLELSRSNGSSNGTGNGVPHRDQTRGPSQHGPGWVFGRLREGVEHESKHLKSTGPSQDRAASDLQTHWAEKSDLLLEARHYFAESEDVAVFFLPMDAIDSAAKDSSTTGGGRASAVIALYELVAALLKEQLLRKMLHVSNLEAIMEFQPESGP
eukprot:gene31283-40653_t